MARTYRNHPDARYIEVPSGGRFGDRHIQNVSKCYRRVGDTVVHDNFIDWNHGMSPSRSRRIADKEIVRKALTEMGA